MLYLNLFGPFDARFENRSVTSFPTDKIRALFAYLAIESDAPHRRQTLSALFWPDYPDEISRRNLRQSLHRLRKTLRNVDPSLPETLLNITRQTIAIHPTAIRLDTARFTQLLTRAGEAPDPLPLLSQAVELYRGELLAGYAFADAYLFDEWLTIQREVFHHQALNALNKLTALHEQRGEPEIALQYALRQIALDPWRESAYRQAMRAHQIAGRRTQALALYEDLKTILARDLDVVPAHESTLLYEQLLHGKISDPANNRSTSHTTSRIHHFPMFATSFVGRDRELADLFQTVQDPDCRLLTVTGSGGVGKTRLCCETARYLAARTSLFPDGIYFVPLAQLENSGLLVSTLAQNLGLNLQVRGDPLSNLINALKDKRLLLVLDNFDHFLIHSGKESNPFVHSLLMNVLQNLPGITLLITSREALNIQSEWLFPVEGLIFDVDLQDSQALLDSPAAKLFVQNARRYRPSFDPTPQASKIYEICRLTGGLPLALEMAAVWLRVYTCEEIARQIAQSLDFLTSPLQDTPPRQQSMRVVFDSSWERLSSRQRTIFSILSVFQGGFTVLAAKEVSGASLLDLATLVEKAFLYRTRHGGKEGRYAMHELVRQFAIEKLAQVGETEARARHAGFFLSLVEELGQALHGPDMQEALGALRRDIDNVRQAWTWAVSTGQTMMIDKSLESLGIFYKLNGGYEEGANVFKMAFEALTPFAGPALLSRLASLQAWGLMGQGKLPLAKEIAQHALELAPVQNDSCKARALSILGWISQLQGDYSDSETLLTQAFQLFQKTDDQIHFSLVCIRLGTLYWRQEDYERTLEYYVQSLEIEQELGNKSGIARSSGGLGLVYKNLGHYAEALEWLQRALQLDRELGNRLGISRHLGNLGSVYQSLGNYTQALACYQEAMKQDRLTGSKVTLAIWQGNIGQVYMLLEDWDLALEHLNRAISLNIEVGDRFNQSDNLLIKVETLLSSGAFAEAQIHLDECLQILQELKRTKLLLRAELLRCRLLSRTGRHKEALKRLKAVLLETQKESNASEALAQIYFEWWRLDGDPLLAREALTRYQTLFEGVPKAEYHRRIEEIEKKLTITLRIS